MNLKGLLNKDKFSQVADRVKGEAASRLDEAKKKAGPHRVTWSFDTPNGAKSIVEERKGHGKAVGLVNQFESVVAILEANDLLGGKLSGKPVIERKEGDEWVEVAVAEKVKKKSKKETKPEEEQAEEEQAEEE